MYIICIHLVVIGMAKVWKHQTKHVPLCHRYVLPPLQICHVRFIDIWNSTQSEHALYIPWMPSLFIIVNSYTEGNYCSLIDSMQWVYVYKQLRKVECAVHLANTLIRLQNYRCWFCTLSCFSSSPILLQVTQQDHWFVNEVLKHLWVINQWATNRPFDLVEVEYGAHPPWN